MSKLGDELIQSLKEALAHAKGEGPTVVHPPISPCAPDSNDELASENEDGNAAD